jgi:REP element-mobilizing transposase RayT
MPRRPREDRPGTWHHVVNRGVAKRPLFESRDDMRYFLSRLALQVRSGRIEVHAYCLMTTHFHLLVRSPIGQMSEALRQAQNAYSRRFNRGHRRDGPLVRGRFFSRLVESVRYRRVLVGYIDVNPVRAGMASSIGEHEFCSARDYSTRTGPPWLCREWVEDLVRFTTGRPTDTVSYRATFGSLGEENTEELVDARLRSRAGADLLDDLIGTAPDQVRTWMDSKARLADGCALGQPVLGPRALRAALDGRLATQGPWFLEHGPATWRGAELVWVGLARRLCGLTWEEIASPAGMSPSRAARLAAAHEFFDSSDENHRARTTAVAGEALSGLYGR